MTWHGIELVMSSADGSFRLQSTGVSMFWPYLIVPISFGLQARAAGVVALRLRVPKNRSQVEQA